MSDVTVELSAGEKLPVIDFTRLTAVTWRYERLQL